MVAADLLELADFVGDALIVAAEELSDGHDHVNLRCTVLQRQCRLGHLHFEEGLGGGKTA